jgi:hypothetical protein
MKSQTRNFIRHLIALCPILFTTVGFAQQILLDVGKAQVRKSVLALPPVQYLGTNDSAANQKLTYQLHQTIKNDLDVTGLFVELPPSIYPEDPMVVGLKPKPVSPNGFDFQKWVAEPI